MAVTLSAGAVAAVLSFVILTIGTYVSSGLFTDGSDLGYSVFTAAITSIVWFGVTYLVSGVLAIEGVAIALGPLLAIIAYVLVIDLLYSGSVIRATFISIGTWIITFAIIYAIAYFTEYSSFEAIGVPPGI